MPPPHGPPPEASPLEAASSKADEAKRKLAEFSLPEVLAEPPEGVTAPTSKVFENELPPPPVPPREAPPPEAPSSKADEVTETLAGAPTILATEASRLLEDEVIAVANPGDLRQGTGGTGNQ